MKGLAKLNRQVPLALQRSSVYKILGNSTGYFQATQVKSWKPRFTTSGSRRGHSRDSQKVDKAENENQADLDEPTTTTLATTNTNLARIWIIIVIYKFKKKGEKDKFISPGVGINPGPGIFILQRQSGHYTRPDAGKRTDP